MLENETAQRLGRMVIYYRQKISLCAVREFQRLPNEYNLFIFNTNPHIFNGLIN